jgi:hypothetical protein
MALWAQLRSPRFALLLLTLGFCLIQAREQPSVDIDLGETVVSVVPGDLLLAALALTSVTALATYRLAREAWPTVAAAVLFCGLVLGTAAFNGTAAVVSAVKFVELAALGLGVLALMRSRQQVEAVVDVLLLFTIAADLYGIVMFVGNGGGRQASFLGEHDFAALATLPLLYGLALLAHGNTRRAWIAVAAGAVGCVLGAALASLLGLYLGAAALLVIAALRQRLRLRQLVLTVAVVALVTGGTLLLRSSDLGFLQSWFGKPASRPGQYASSWSQRLIYAYIGGRVFEAHPFLGTGWYGNLPPKTFVMYLPDARRRFSDQPARYFPARDRPFVPQQTFDQVLYELGLVGGLAFLALLAAVARSAIRVAAGSRDAIASLPAAWLLAALGALAGEGLFGGTPLTATFWLVAGVAVAFAVPGRSLA